MPVLGRLDNCELLVYEEVAGPANYQAGNRPTVVFNDLKQAVTRVFGVVASDGRVVDQAALAGRTLTYRVRQLPNRILRAAQTVNHDPAQVGAAATLDVAIPVPGAADGDPFLVIAPALEANLGIVMARGSGVDEVTVRLLNPTAAGIDPAAQDFIFVNMRAQADALLEEVADGTDLSGSTYRVLASGV